MITEIEKLERIKKLKQLLPDADYDEQRAYIIQLKELLPPAIHILRVDADSLLYMATFSPKYKQEKAIEGGTFKSEDIVKTTLKDYKIHLDEIIAEVVRACEYQSMLGNMERFKDYELVFTSSTNFRYDIFPEYKYRRALRPKNNTLIRIKKYAKANLGVVPEGIEADDYVYYYGMKGDPVASGDKDVINSIPSGVYWYHGQHKEVITNTIESATKWLLLQCVMGDAGDDIPGIEGIGEGTAKKLLGDTLSFDRVIEIYQGINVELEDKKANSIVKKAFEKKMYTKEDAILTRRLVGLDQWSGPRRNKVRLFTCGTITKNN